MGPQSQQSTTATNSRNATGVSCVDSAPFGNMVGSSLSQRSMMLFASEYLGRILLPTSSRDKFKRDDNLAINKRVVVGVCAAQDHSAVSAWEHVRRIFAG